MSLYCQFINKIANDIEMSTFDAHYNFANAIEDIDPPRPFSSGSSDPLWEIYLLMINSLQDHPDEVPIYSRDEWMDLIQKVIKAYEEENIGEVPERLLGFSWEIK